MEVDELKEYLKVDGNDLDTVLEGYMAAAETYLTNAGITKDYTNGLYKTVVTVFCGTLLENPSLIVAGKGSLDSLSITLNALVAQLRFAQ